MGFGEPLWILKYYSLWIFGNSFGLWGGTPFGFWVILLFFFMDGYPFNSGVILHLILGQSLWVL